jgi:hypothetical protein
MFGSKKQKQQPTGSPRRRNDYQVHVRCTDGTVHYHENLSERDAARIAQREKADGGTRSVQVFDRH